MFDSCEVLHIGIEESKRIDLRQKLGAERVVGGTQTGTTGVSPVEVFDADVSSAQILTPAAKPKRRRAEEEQDAAGRFGD